MEFHEELNTLLAEIGCSSKELSQASGLSETTVSR